MQTKLQNFFKKASDASPDITTPTDESDNEDTLVIDENDDQKSCNDATLQLTEHDSEVGNHNDTTIKINSSHSDENSPTKETNRFVINITLEGVPSKGKHINNSISDDASDVSSIEKPIPAKRKIKALFGESSDEESDTAPQKRKKIKSADIEAEPEKPRKKSMFSKTKHERPKKSKSTSRDNNSENIKKNKSTDSEMGQDKLKKSKSADIKVKKEKHKKKQLIDSSSDSETENQNHKPKRKHSKHDKEYKKAEKTEMREKEEKQNKSSITENKITLFGNDLESDSEKELVVDDESESHVKSTDPEETFKLEDTESKIIDLNSSTESKTSLEEKNYDEKSVPETSSETDITISENNKSGLLSSSNYKKLDKAHKLSLEAEEVLAKLKQFAETPQEPLIVTEPVKVVELKLEKTKKPLSPSPIKIDKAKENPKKHRLSLSSKPRDHKKNKLDKDGKFHKEKERHKHRHIEKTEKKTEKLDVAGLVVKLLMPYYKNKHISSRDLFKITARHIVHQLLAIQVTGM